MTKKELIKSIEMLFKSIDKESFRDTDFSNRIIKYINDKLTDYTDHNLYFDMEDDKLIYRENDDYNDTARNPMKLLRDDLDEINDTLGDAFNDFMLMEYNSEWDELVPHDKYLFKCDCVINKNCRIHAKEIITDKERIEKIMEFLNAHDWCGFSDKREMLDQMLTCENMDKEIYDLVYPHLEKEKGGE